MAEPRSTRSQPAATEGHPSYRAVGHAEASAAVRAWWDASAAGYQDEHEADLGGPGGIGFLWGPEGLREDDAGLLGPVGALRGRQVLEVGCGGGQCGRWLRARGVDVLGVDLSAGQLRASRRYDAVSGVRLPAVQADALHLPLPDASVDAAFSAFGAVAFVTDLAALHREVARVLRPGGRWVYSRVHPMTWCLPDDPTEQGLRVIRSYFDRTPYVETADDGTLVYAAPHATVGDLVRAAVGAGFRVLDLVEPEWPPERSVVWAQWGPERGRTVPGTVVVVAERG